MAAYYGRGPENRLRPIGGHYDLWQGKDLADNQWHTVEVVRNIRESIIIIDKGGGKGVEKTIFMKAPPTYNELSVSMVTFAGYYSFALSEVDDFKSLSRKGLKACFSEATFSQYWPEENAREIDFLKEGTLVGPTPVNGCPDTNPPYKPMFFPSSAVHIALINNYTIQNMKVELKFRTVISEQIIANYTTKYTGEKVQLKIDRKGKLVLGIDIDDNTQVIETAKEGYHDSLWHSVAFEIDNKATAEGEYQLKFEVDGKTRLSAMSKAFYFNGFVNVGFSFTGCMRDLKINNDPIEKIRMNPKKSNEYFRIEDVGVVHGQCSLKDYCTPNPCQNGGKCNQTEDNIVCDCKNTLYEGSTCHRG